MLDCTPGQPLQQWQQQTSALLVALVGARLLTVNDLRRHIGSLDLQPYSTWGQYDKWSVAMALGLLENGVVLPKDVDAALGFYNLDDDGNARSEADSSASKKDVVDAGMDAGGQLAYLADQLARGRSYYEPTWMEHTRNPNGDGGNKGGAGNGGVDVSPARDHTHTHGQSYSAGDFTLTEVPPPPSHSHSDHYSPLEGGQKFCSEEEDSSYRPIGVYSHEHTPELRAVMKQKALDLQGGEKPGARVVHALLAILEASGLLRIKKN